MFLIFLTQGWPIPGKLRVIIGRILTVVNSILSAAGLLVLGICIGVNGELADQLLGAADLRPTVRTVGVSGAWMFVLHLIGAKMCLDASRPRTNGRWLAAGVPWIICLFFLVIFVFLAGIISLVASAQVTSLMEKGVKKAMDLYAVDVQIKAYVDNLQVTHMCCGNDNYQDWFNTQWVDIKFAEPPFELTANGLTDSVPFSCCNPNAFRPCVHYQVTQSAKHTPLDDTEGFSIYTRGCGRLLARSNAVALTIAGTVLMLSTPLQLVALFLGRFLFTSAWSAKMAGNPSGVGLGHLLADKGAPWRSLFQSKDQCWGSPRATGGTTPDESMDINSTTMTTSSAETLPTPHCPRSKSAQRLRSGTDGFVSEFRQPVSIRRPSLSPLLPRRLRPSLSPML